MTDEIQNGLPFEGPASNKDAEELMDKAKASLSPSNYFAFRKLLPKFAARVGAMAVVTALLAGNADALNEPPTLQDLRGSNSSLSHKQFCEQLIKLNNLRFEEQLLAASYSIKLNNLRFEEQLLAASYSENEKYTQEQRDTIIAIAKACNDSGFDLEIALKIASLESDFGKRNTNNAWNNPDNIVASVHHLAAQNPDMVRDTERKFDFENEYADLDALESFMSRIKYRARAIFGPKNNYNPGDYDTNLRISINEYKKHEMARIFLERLLGKEQAAKFLSAASHKDNRNNIVTGLLPGGTKLSASARSTLGKTNGTYQEIYTSLIEQLDGLERMQEKDKALLIQKSEGSVESRVIANVNLRRKKDGTYRKARQPIGEMTQEIERRLATTNVAQATRDWTTVTYTGGMKNPVIKRPHLIYNGYVNQASVDSYLEQLERDFQRAEKGAYYYGILNTPGGSVNAAYDMVERINALIEKYPHVKFRIVAIVAHSAGMYITGGINATRMVLEGTSSIAHAPRVRFKDGSICFWETCTDPALRDSLARDITKFARRIAERSCVLNENLARLLFKKEDLSLTSEKMLRLGIVDYTIRITKNGWFTVTKSVAEGVPKCAPLEIDELMELATGFATPTAPAVNGDEIVPPVPQPARRP